MATHRSSPTVSTAIYEQLRALIVRGRLMPGTRLTEADVAQQLNASRTPAREALRRLRQERLLVATGSEDRGKVRLAVAPMTNVEARDLYLAAGALEGVVALQIDRIPAAERKRLAAQLQAAENAFRKQATRKAPDWDRLFELHDAFHRTFVDALAGPQLRILLDELRPHVDRYEYLYAPLLGTGFEATFAEHAAIIRGIASGNAAAAERAVRANWFRGAERLSTAVQRAGEAGFLRGLQALDVRHELGRVKRSSTTTRAAARRR